MAIVRQVHLYCFRCKFSKTYPPEENLPDRCPNCGIAVKVAPRPLREIVRYLPTGVWLGVIIGLPLWLIFGGEFFTVIFVLSAVTLVWLLAVVFLPGERQQLWFVLKWPGQDNPPENIIGQKVLLEMVGSRHRRMRTAANIQGFKVIWARRTRRQYTRSGWRILSRRLYILQAEEGIPGIVRGGQRVLFHPEEVEFKKGTEGHLKRLYGDFGFTASIEDLLLNLNCQYVAVRGTLPKLKSPENITKPGLRWSDMSPPFPSDRAPLFRLSAHRLESAALN